MGSLVSILWTIAVILIILWLLGLLFNIAGFAANGLIHVLLVIAIIVIIYNLLTGRRVV